MRRARVRRPSQKPSAMYLEYAVEMRRFESAETLVGAARFRADRCRRRQGVPHSECGQKLGTLKRDESPNNRMWRARKRRMPSYSKPTAMNMGYVSIAQTTVGLGAVVCSCEIGDANYHGMNFFNAEEREFRFMYEAKRLIFGFTTVFTTGYC
jgi:hypothetical protein